MYANFRSMEGTKGGGGIVMRTMYNCILYSGADINTSQAVLN